MFHSGQKVRCVDDAGTGIPHGLQHGAIYTVSGHYLDGHGNFIFLEETPGRPWYPRRFESAERGDVQFSKGQQVRCVNADRTISLREGMIYAVKSDDGHMVTLEGVFGDPPALFAKRRFETLKGERSIHYVPPKAKAPSLGEIMDAAAKTDGFVPFYPFEPSRPTLKKGDRVRIETEVKSTAGTQFQTDATGDTAWLHINDVAALKPGPRGPSLPHKSSRLRAAERSCGALWWRVCEAY